MECRFYHLVKSCIKASDYAKCGPINRLFFSPSRPQVFTVFFRKKTSMHVTNYAEVHPELRRLTFLFRCKILIDGCPRMSTCVSNGPDYSSFDEQ